MISLLKFPVDARRPIHASPVAEAYADAISREDVPAANELLPKAFPAMAGRVREVRRLCDAGVCEVTFHYGVGGTSSLVAVSIKRFL